MPAGRCRFSPNRRAFFISFSRRHGHFDAGGGEFASVCPLVAAALRLAGVHFSSRFPAGMIILTLAARNLSSCARWSLPLFASPACIFHPVLRRHDHFDAGGEEFVFMYSLATAVLYLAGVHFSSRFPAGMVVLPLPAGNLPPCARWSLPFFISPACIFHPISPPAWSFRRCRRGICLRVPAGRCRSSPRRRAFFIPFHRWRAKRGLSGNR